MSANLKEEMAYNWPKTFTGVRIGVQRPDHIELAVDAMNWKDYEDSQDIAQLYRSAGVEVIDVLIEVEGQGSQVFTFEEFEEAFDVH